MCNFSWECAIFAEQTKNNIHMKELIDIIKRLGVATNGETVYFEPNTYDFQEDIPRLEFKEGKGETLTEMRIQTKDNMVVVTMNTETSELVLPIDTSDTKLPDFLQTVVNLEDILRDFYYGSSASWDIGDYELDFLPNRYFRVGDKVKWNDPAIDDFEPEEREFQNSRIFEIYEIRGEVIGIADEHGDSEVFAGELEIVTRAE